MGVGIVKSTNENNLQSVIMPEVNYQIKKTSCKSFVYLRVRIIFIDINVNTD